MSPAVGVIAIGEQSEDTFLSRDVHHTRNYSEETARLVDAEVRRIIDEAYTTAKEILTTKRAYLNAIAEALLERETISGSDITLIMEDKELPPVDID